VVTAVQQSFPSFVAPEHCPEATLAERFEAFHALNPWVADELEELAVEALAFGEKRIGIKHFVEVLRWNYRRATTGDEWRLNNNWTSRYARLLIERRPELAQVIETRELRAA
jgi:hypothetical protein